MYQARALLNALTYSNRSFEDNCDDTQDARFVSFNEEETTSITESNYFKLYPNPNNGSFMLSYNLKRIPDASLIITDVTGKVVFETNIDNLNNFKTINISNYQNGIYFIQLSTKVDGLLWTDKIIINK